MVFWGFSPILSFSTHTHTYTHTYTHTHTHTHTHTCTHKLQTSCSHGVFNFLGKPYITDWSRSDFSKAVVLKGNNFSPQEALIMSGDLFNFYNLHPVGRDQQCYLQCTRQLPTIQGYLVQNMNSAKARKHCATERLLRTAIGYRKEIWPGMTACERLSWVIDACDMRD